MGLRVSYFVEFFQIAPDGRRVRVHEETHHGATLEHARRYAASVMKYTTFSGIRADLGTISDQRRAFLCEVPSEGRL